MPIAKTKHFQLIWKNNQNVAFHEPETTLKISYNWLCILELSQFFCFSAAEGARKLMKTKHIFTSPGKTEL